MKVLPEEKIRLGQLNNLQLLTKKCPLKICWIANYFEQYSSDPVFPYCCHSLRVQTKIMQETPPWKSQARNTTRKSKSDKGFCFLLLARKSI
jgi:hypothetical protein